MLDKIISWSFYLLFFLTPLFWSSLNYELFEFNKMFLVYGFTVIIVGCWLLKMINEKRLTIKRTPLDIPLLLFLGANILSTVFSMDPHTSIWGYYSRLNGGLLSLVSYLLLYWAFVSNMDLEKVKTTLKFGLASGFIIALWAILEHFGVSFSCVILRGEFNAGCWIQDVQARVFATLGQPNWLAAYLAMLIFPALYFFLTETKRLPLYTYYIILATYYLAFTFTYSRGPTLGLIGGFVVFILICLRISNFKFLISNELIKNLKLKIKNYKAIILVITSFIIINILFGSALTSFRLVSKFAAPARPGIALPVSVGTQLENGGTESGQIRFIVWKGALDIFKHNPFFGSGLETFAYSYYQYRPAEHNLTSEWDFLYNKAHNEYLNYLATTGIVGFGTYMLVIGTFIFWCIQRISKSKFLISNQIPNPKSQLGQLEIRSIRNLVLALLAAYISYLIYNFFLFSVVIIAVFFYLFPALAFVVTNSTKEFVIIKKLPSFLSSKIARGIIVFSIFYILYSIFQLWYADTVFAKGQKASNAGNPGRAYNFLAVAVDLNTSEPFYRSELAYAAAEAAASLEATDASLSAELKDEAISQTNTVFKISPRNISYFRTAVRTYFALSDMDKTLQMLNSAISLAPTDPKLYYNKALILEAVGKKDEKIRALQEAIKLKPNYLEAAALLKEAK